MNCVMCKGTDLELFLDLGFTPPADQFRRREQLREPDVHYPLEVVVCRNCGLSQLNHIVSPEVLYRQDYPYESSTTKMGQVHWTEFAQSTVKALGLGKDDLVVDIGSNVGVLLSAFRAAGTRILGVDPAANIALLAEKRGVETYPEFFSPEVADRIVREKGQASLMTGTNVFAHVGDLDSFMLGAEKLLNDRGVLVIEAPYFANLVGNLEYDTIYHEHISYLSVKPMAQFFARFGMEIFDVLQRDIHGGSFRVFVTRKGRRPVQPVVAELLASEEKKRIHDPAALKEFAKAVEKNRQDLLWLLRSLRHDGKRIAAVSAPAKGMTLLNYCRIGGETLDFVTEKSQLKIGRFTPGAHVPVLPDSELLARMPDYALLLAWNFAPEIMANLSEYTKRGGKFIIPIPTPKIVG